jgi:hypothetical protein
MVAVAIRRTCASSDWSQHAMATAQPIALESRAAPQVAPRRRLNERVFLSANGLALLAVAIFLRCWHLGNLPGVNGDEAWYGVQALHVASGQAITWLTPTGNPLNLFYFLPLVALHYVLPPSVVLLRVVPLVSGTAALAVNYVLCRGAFDVRTARVSTLILALLPLNIAYSRFGWDASQSLLATLLVMYLPLMRLRASEGRAALNAGAAFAAAAAILVHPTNLFALVLLFVPAVYVRREKLGRVLRRTRVPAKSWAFAGLVTLVGVCALAAWRWAPAAADRLHGPADVGSFVAGYLRLFSGTAIYQFISGAGLATAEAGWYGHTTWACNVGFALLALFALLGFVRRLGEAPAATDVCLAFGWLLMLAAFFVIAGPRALAPHFERYAVCLIAPGALVVSRGLCWWMDRSRFDSNRLAVALALAAWLWPASFYVNYFRPFFERGGISHQTFRTGEVEPKLSALDLVLARRHGPVEIVCHEWWSYWPLAYLAYREPDVRVVTWQQWQAEQRDQADYAAETWFVEYGGSSGAWDAQQVVAGTKARWFPVFDYGQRPTIWVVGPLEKDFQNY